MPKPRHEKCTCIIKSKMSFTSISISFLSAYGLLKITHLSRSYGRNCCEIPVEYIVMSFPIYPSIFIENDMEMNMALKFCVFCLSFPLPTHIQFIVTFLRVQNFRVRQYLLSSICSESQVPKNSFSMHCGKAINFLLYFLLERLERERSCYFSIILLILFGLILYRYFFLAWARSLKIHLWELPELSAWKKATLVKCPDSSVPFFATQTDIYEKLIKPREERYEMVTGPSIQDANKLLMGATAFLHLKCSDKWDCRPAKKRPVRTLACGRECTTISVALIVISDRHNRIPNQTSQTENRNLPLEIISLMLTPFYEVE